jgi:putative transposase
VLVTEHPVPELGYEDQVSVESENTVSTSADTFEISHKPTWYTVGLMQLRYNFRVYPDAVQRTALAQAFGCARVVFNDGLRLRQQAREAGEKHLSDADLSKLVITHAKATEDRAWLGEVSAVVLQQALADLNTAYRNFLRLGHR